MEHDRPWISANLAISGDGKISTTTRRPSTWTSAADHERLKALRLQADALLVGRGTWEKDRMTLTSPQNPLRCVVSHRGNFEFSHPMFSTAGGPIHLLITEDSPLPKIQGAEVHQEPLPSFLLRLSRLGIRHLHCEGGGELIRSLTSLDVLDEIHLTWAGHWIFGGGTAPTLSGLPDAFFPASRSYVLEKIEPTSAAECFLTYRRCREKDQ